MTLDQRIIHRQNFYQDVFDSTYNAIWEISVGNTSRSAEYSDQIIQNIEMNPLTWTLAQSNIVFAPNSDDLWVHISVDSAQRINPPNADLQAWVELLNIRLELFLRQRDNDSRALTDRTVKVIDDFQKTLEVSKFVSTPLEPLARIDNAGISSWSYDERLRGTNEEIIVFIFQVQVQHYIDPVEDSVPMFTSFSPTVLTENTPYDARIFAVSYTHLTLPTKA